MAKPKTFTVMCQENTGRGTIWLDTVQALPDSPVVIIQQIAIDACAAAWEMSPEYISCMAVIQGEPVFLHFDDSHYEEP